MNKEILPTEKHPLQPFLPEGARILMLGSFPPARKRWSMDFFYPNWINDMWRIWGLIFFGDKEYFVAESSAGTKLKAFDKERCSGFAAEKGIAMYDTAYEVRRLRDNASDKFLEVVQTTDILSLLEDIPECSAIVTTGQKATDVIVEMFGCEEPEVGEYTEFTFTNSTVVTHKSSGDASIETVKNRTRSFRFWRMPSSSRAYPLPLEEKAEFYRVMFRKEIGLFPPNNQQSRPYKRS